MADLHEQADAEDQQAHADADGADGQPPLARSVVDRWLPMWWYHAEVGECPAIPVRHVCHAWTVPASVRQEPKNREPRAMHGDRAGQVTGSRTGSDGHHGLQDPLRQHATVQSTRSAART